MSLKNRFSKNKNLYNGIVPISLEINRIYFRVFESISLKKVLSQFFPDRSAKINLTPLMFGYTSFVHIHSNNWGKLDPRAIKCVFVRYSSTWTWYKCFHPTINRLCVLTGVTFAARNHIVPKMDETSYEKDKDFSLGLLSLDIISPLTPLASDSIPSNFPWSLETNNHFKSLLVLACVRDEKRPISGSKTRPNYQFNFGKKMTVSKPNSPPPKISCS